MSKPDSAGDPKVAIYSRLAKAVCEMHSPKANKTNPHFRSKYATLDHILETARPVLAKHGLAIIQAYGTTSDGRRAISTLLIGAEGMVELGSPFPLPMKEETAQGMMSASTSTRRMTIQGALGISTDQDDDGAAASAQPAAKKWVPNPSPAATTAKPNAQAL